MNYQIVSKAKYLYIIGNGFDLHHGINSSYLNFRKWLHDNAWETFMQIEEIYGECDSEWWSDFESRLGSLDVMQYSTQVASQNSPDLLSEHCDRTWSDAQLAVEKALQSVYLNLRYCFYNWIKQLNLPQKSRMIDLKATSIYLNFNYTKTLETIYRIKSDFILYIHGCVDGGEFVLGHGNSYEKIKQNNQLFGLEFYEQLALEEAISAVAAQAKPVKEIIQANQIFFKSLQDIKTVHVYGLSLSDVDLPYLNLIARNTFNVKWEFSDFQNRNYSKIEKFVLLNGIINYNIIQLEDVMNIGN